MQIKPQFTFEQVRFDQENPVHLVLSVEAPKSDWQQNRPPLCLIPVLDISGSMSGPKLDYAKKSLLKLVEHLSADDFFGLVSFSSNARVDFEPGKMTPERKEQARAIIGKYHTEGSTNFSGGMLLGLQLANKLDLPEATLVRVIMFTDGQPTHGVTDQKGLCDLLGKQSGRASVSAFGYGEDACQELLLELSSAGKGNYAFVKDPDAALAAFGKELGGLLSTYAQDVVIELAPHHGHQIVEVLSDADVEEETTGEVRIKVPHLLSEETLSLVLSVKLAAQKQPGPRQVNAFDAKLTYQVLTAEGKLEARTDEAKAKVQFVKPGEEQVKPTPAVDEIVARAQLVKAQIEAEAAAKRGDYKTAGAVFKGLNLADRGHVGVAAVADHVQHLYASPASFNASAGNRIGMRRAMTRGVGASALAAEDEAVLGFAGYTVSNQVQAETAQRFSGGDQVAPVDLGVGTSSSTPTPDPVGNPLLFVPAVVTLPPDQVSPVPSAEPEKPRLAKSRSQRW